MTHGSLFSGIGGFDLAAEWMGWDNLFHCEWNPFGQKVLHHYWPNAEQFTDITKSNFTKYANRIDVLTGGFPCQPYSVAGKRLGKEDERHLWPEMLRAIREIQPRYVVGENVAGLVNWNGGMVFDEVQTDLENQGYEVIPFILPACGVNAIHKRDRIWFLAHANKKLQNAVVSKNSFDKNGRWQKEKWSESWGKFKLEPGNKDSPTYFTINKSVEPSIISRNDGIPEGLDRETFCDWIDESNGAYGNAVVPEIPYRIFQAIQQFENTINA